MCVELDLRKERMQFIWIDLFEGLKQPIVYERVPKFCIGCQVQGHTHVECSKSSLDTPQPQDLGPFPAVQERSQPVRRIVDDNSAAVSHESPHQSRAPTVAAAAPIVSASDIPHQDPPDISFQQPHPPPPSQPPLPAAAQQLPADQPHLQSTVAAASHSTVAAATYQLCDLLPHPPPPSQPLLPAAATHQPASEPVRLSSATAVPPSVQDQGPSAAVPHLASDPPPSSGIPPSPSNPMLIAASQQLPAVHPNLQSTSAAESHPPHPPPPSKTEASSSSQLPAAAVSPFDSDPHLFSAPPPPSEFQQAGHPSNPPPAAVRPTALSAQAAPFPSSDPVQSVQQTSSLNNQHSTSSLRVYVNANGAKCMTMPSRPLWEMVNRQQGKQGHLSSIINAPSPSYNHHQIHALEGYDSEGSFETDSQPNSPLESPKEDANKCPFPPQSCASEGEQPTEDHPGFQGHISDVEFYHRPMSSKKNKRQPDGPLRVQLRTRKGPSVHK